MHAGLCRFERPDSRVAEFAGVRVTRRTLSRRLATSAASRACSMLADAGHAVAASCLVRACTVRRFQPIIAVCQRTETQSDMRGTLGKTSGTVNGPDASLLQLSQLDERS